MKYLIDPRRGSIEEANLKPGTFTQIYIHLIFAVKYRDRLLNKEIRPEVFKYISKIITNRNHKPYIVNGVSDHIHILIGYNPNDKIPDLVCNIKRSSSTFINEKKLLPGTFHWQGGYGAFSYSKSQVNRVFNYIKNQENHHKRKKFKKEYVELLDRFDVGYNKKYLFEFFE